jgi:hypothetical protein
VQSHRSAETFEGRTPAADSNDQVDVFEACVVAFNQRRARMTLACTSETFTEPQLVSTLHQCGGEVALDEEIFNLITHVKKRIVGGLALNCFQIGIGSDGCLGSSA